MFFFFFLPFFLLTKVFGLSAFVKREETNSCCGLRSLPQCLLRRPLGSSDEKNAEQGASEWKALRKLLVLSSLLKLV